MQVYIISKFIFLYSAFGKAATDDLPPIETKILGGSTVFIEDAPFMAAIENDNGLLCSGVIVSKNQVITAAHCTNGRTNNTIKVRIGSTFRQRDGHILNVKKIHQNPNFNVDYATHDVSVLDIDPPIVPSSTSSPVALAPVDYILKPNTEAKIFGWGSVSADSLQLSQKLRTVTVKIIDKATCQKAYSEVKITEQMVCAGIEKGGKDACEGDSGGPLIIDDVLVGVTSWGTGCGEAHHYGVYTNISNLRSFIDPFVTK